MLKNTGSPKAHLSVRVKKYSHYSKTIVGSMYYMSMVAILVMRPGFYINIDCPFL